MSHLNDYVAREIVRDRVTARLPLQRPRHPRTARVLHKLAYRIER